MIRRSLVALVASLLLGVAGAGTALAANPPGTGQPSQSCGSAGATSAPPGFSTRGFSNAESHYAGSLGTPSTANGNPKVVAQYDVACFQQTSNGH